MDFIVNSDLTDKLKDIKEIGVDTDRGMIMAIYEDDSIKPLSQEIFELVVVSLMDKNKTIIECFDREYVITCNQNKGVDNEK